MATTRTALARLCAQRGLRATVAGARSVAAAAPTIAGAVAGPRLVASSLAATRGLASASHSDFETVRHAPVPANPEEVQAMIDAQVKDHKVMLYMKGTPAMPQCGFSQQVVRILHATGAEFSSVNVLEDASIREGVKQYSQWPTIPQLYVGAEPRLSRHCRAKLHVFSCHSRRL